ncbi:MAG: ABC transporter permease [Verrucomicrobia bacterium]|nr:ABC transporter permease [Verrucomicrobiota bacterium]
MANYLLRRLLLIPLTLLAILLVNFTVINLAPGDPSTILTSALSADGSRAADQGTERSTDDQYLLFREHYGLTRPILFNLWPGRTKNQVKEDLEKLLARPKGMSARAHAEFRVRVGDRSRYTLPLLLELLKDPSERSELQKVALEMFKRGGTLVGTSGGNLTPEMRSKNQQIARSNQKLRQIKTAQEAQAWWEEHRQLAVFEFNRMERAALFLTGTRLTGYLQRVLTLDFGAMRNDSHRLVSKEVVKRMKVSLTLAFAPMLISFFLCQLIGFTMAVFHNRWPDYFLNLMMLFLYAVPVFVVAPFLIEKVALPHAWPTSGFHSSWEVYSGLTSWHRLLDIALHIFLPLTAVLYGTLAAQARLSRTAVLEVLRQPYVRTAYAKGLAPFKVLTKHVGRNAAITIVTSLASSLGVVLSGSLIVETIFGIDGFGRFFYEAIVNRDYNVIMFSALAGGFLALIGYLIADILYTLLDPRVTFVAQKK